MVNSDTETISLTNFDAEHVLAALQRALDLIGPTAASRIFFVGAADTVRALATLPGVAGQAFPQIGITGGTLLGRPLLVFRADRGRAK